MQFERTNLSLHGKSGIGAPSRRPAACLTAAAAALGLALLAALAPGAAPRADAQTAPNPNNPTTVNAAATLIATPWSWVQAAQSQGTNPTGVGYNYYASNPGVPTILQDSPTGEATANEIGTELRGFVLGDYFNATTNTTEQPTDLNFTNYNFYETSGGNTLGSAGATGWVSPLFSLSSSRDLCVQTVDASGVTAGTTGTVQANGSNGFTTVTNTIDVGQVGTTYDEAAVAGGATYTWTLTAPGAGYYTIYADIPNDTSIARSAGASYTIKDAAAGTTVNATADQTGYGYVQVGGVTTVGADTITVTLNANGSTGTGDFVVADALQLRQPRTASVDNLDTQVSGADFQFSNGTNPWNVDTTAGDQNGADYLNSTTILRGSTASTPSYAYWLFNVPTTGAYSLSVYYPVQYEEYFSIDAQYTVKIYNFTGQTAATITADLANNTVGTDNLAYTTTTTIDQTIDGGAYQRVFGTLSIPAGDTAVLQLDNTSATPIYEGEPRIVVADSAELTPDDGTVYGSVTAANTTNDAPELAAGEGNSSAAAPGGGGVAYETPPVDSASGVVAATGTVETYGTFQNTVNIPVAQVAYFGRAENVPFNGVNGENFTPGVSQQNGAVYAVDGLTGSIIWRFGANDTIIDDSSATEFSPGTNFSATEVTADTDYYGDGYRTAPALATASGTDTPASWTLPATAQTQEYDVYVWFPSASATEPHIKDAAYSVNDLDTGFSATDTVSQLVGGQWVQLQSARPNGSFYMGAGSSVQLSDVASDITGYDNTGAQVPAATAAAQVVADAALFVPVNSPGPVMSTPLLVRNMKVIGADGNYYKRDCLIFTDNLGKMYCVDAAGNGDANNTLEDANGNPVSLDAAGYPAVGPTVTGTSPAFAFTNTATTGITLPTPYNLHVADYGTTTVYWIWQPNPSNGAVVLHTAIAGDTADSTETTPDPNRDMPAPGPFFNCSPTDGLIYDSANQWYTATIFVGNPNGYLYSLNGEGEPAESLPTVNPPTTNTTTQYRISEDPTVPTPLVHWWFNTGESIASTPTYDPDKAVTGNPHVYVTTYSSAFNNQGHLYSIDAALGGYGNKGAGYDVPGTYNYNVTPLCYWTYPDKYGVASSANPSHYDNSLVGGANSLLPSLPLGDMAGSATVENIDSSGAPHILVCANDPGPPTEPGETGFGRVYAINENGTLYWEYPTTGADPNTLGSTSTSAEYSAVYTQPTYSTGDTPGDTNYAEDDFTTSIIADDPNDDPLFVSSSPVCGIVQFPTTALSALPYALGALSNADNSALLTNAAVPMAYVGTLGGHLLALDLNGRVDDTTGALVNDPLGHLVSDTIVGDSASIYSTPALLPGSSGAASNVGGTVYVNAADPAMYELEALPATVDANNFPVEPQYFTYGSLGGVSSPSLAAFNATAYNNKVTVNNTESGTGGTVETASGDVEFLYSGSDGGYAYGLTPNTTSTNPGGGGSGFVPGFLIPSGNLPPAGANLATSNKYIVVRLTSSLTNTNYANSYGADASALFDWGQTAYVQVYGVYQPGPATSGSATTSVTPPYSLSLTYTLSGGGKGGGSTSVTVTSSNTQLATNVPSTVTTLFDGSQTYVTTFPITIGQGTAYLPGTRRTLRNLTLSYIDQNGALQTIRLNQGSATRYRTFSGNPPVPSSSRPTITPLPATLTILNPLAVTGGGKTLDNNINDFPNMGEVGPLGGIGGNFFKLPSTQTGSNAYSLRSAPADIAEAQVNGNPTINGTSALVAVGLGDIAHNTAGDSSTGLNGDPAPNATASATADPTDPHLGYTVTGSPDTYGSSLFLLTDRSALGTIGSSIGNVYISNNTDTQLAWNDNTGQEGPGSVINNLSWDTAPVDQHSNPTGNPSPDYPNISAQNLTATLVARSQSAGSSSNVPGGVSASITQVGGTLAPSSIGSGTGDPSGTRTVYPNATIVKVAVPKYQPANLEVFRPNTPTPGAAFGGTEVSPHTGNTALVANTDVPEGYVATSRVFIDLSNNHAKHVFNPNTAAYRAVSVYVGVPVDMSMSVDQPTVDVGTVPAGFADQVQQAAGTQIPWQPFARSNAAKQDPTAAVQSTEYYAQYYQPITVRNNGNVNLLNVHVDSSVALDPGAGDTPVQSYIRLSSDQAETPYTLANELAPAIWTDSLGFIPSIDPNGLLLNGNFNGANPPGQLLLRSSLDPDVYLQNAEEADLNGQANGNHSNYPNPTLHKSRPGDGEASTLTVPDEPHDSGNPAYVALTKSDGNPNVPYYGTPVVGIAVPLGTPVGTYSGTIRTYEGSDPYDRNQPDEKPDSTYSGTYTGPHYTRATADVKNGGVDSSDDQTAFYVNQVTGVPEQYYSNPGTTLKIAVREGQFTDGPPLVGAATSVSDVSPTPFAPFLNLPNGDAAPSVANAGEPVPTTDVEPFVFSVPQSGDPNLYDMGLLFVSNRATVSATSGTSDTYDLFTSGMLAQSSTGSALTVPSGQNGTSWWTAPANQTKLTAAGTGALAAQISSPFVLTTVNSNASGAFFVLRNVTAATVASSPLSGKVTASSTGAPVYTVYEAPFNGQSNNSADGLPVDMADAVPLYTSTDPIFGVHAVQMPDNGGTERIVVLWQARVRGRSRVEYVTGTSGNGGVMLTKLDSTTPSELPVSASLVDVQSPSPVLRVIDSATGDYGSAPGAGQNTTLSLEGTNTATNFALDVTYSGTLQDGTTDLYTSRYALNAPTTGVNAAAPTLTREAIVPQLSTDTTAPFTTTLLTLTRSGTDTGLFYARDVDWAASLGAITVNYATSTVSAPGFLPNTTGGKITQAYSYDKASGQIVYTGVQLPWQTIGTLGTVYVNPGLGTVRFSTPPTDPTTLITANVVPLSERITYNSRTNTEPVAFLDDALEPTITASTTNPIAPAHVSREWFIYRKSGSATGATSATNDTLYYDTRRLTVNLAQAVNGTTSVVTGTTSIETTNGANGTYLTSFDVTIGTTSGTAQGGQDVASLVDVDPVRARVYFPSNMEGLWAYVTYKDQTGTTQHDSAQILWADEPYVNAQSPSIAAVGEHVLPIAAAANESNPSAFLDPSSGLQTVSSNPVYVPHRVWVFWSSTRNAAPQQYVPGAATGTGSTGSDLYYESIDPLFTPDLP